MRTDQIVSSFFKYTCRLFHKREVTQYTIYYTSHGKRNGNWSCDDDSYVTLEQILSIWSTSGAGCRQGVSLLIISDSCCADVWVRKLDRYHRYRTYENVEMIGAPPSIRYKIGKGSYFTKAICEGSPCPPGVTVTHSLQSQQLKFIHITESIHRKRKKYIITLLPQGHR